MLYHLVGGTRPLVPYETDMLDANLGQKGLVHQCALFVIESIVFLDKNHT